MRGKRAFNLEQEKNPLMKGLVEREQKLLMDEKAHLENLVESVNLLLEPLGAYEVLEKYITHTKHHLHLSNDFTYFLKELREIRKEFEEFLKTQDVNKLNKLENYISSKKNHINKDNLSSEHTAELIANVEKHWRAYRDELHEVENIHLMQHRTASVTPERIAELSAEAAKEMEYEYAGRMVKSNLFNICEQSRALMPMFEDDENVEPWLEEKIAVAAHMVSTAYQYKNYDTNSDKTLPPEVSRKITAKYIIKRKK